MILISRASRLLWAHLDYHSVDTKGFSSPGLSDWDAKLTTGLCLVPRLRIIATMCRYNSAPPYIFAVYRKTKLRLI